MLKNHDELVCYLLSDGTCKCGLRCPFQLDEQFSFESTVIGLPDSQDYDLADTCCVVAHRESQGSCRATVTTAATSDEVESGETVEEADDFIAATNGASDITEVLTTPVKIKKMVACDGDFQVTNYRDPAMVSESSSVVVAAGGGEFFEAEEGEESLPISVQLDSISDAKFHTKFVDLLRTVDRCFQLLQPQSVPSPQLCSNGNLLRQHRMSRRLNFTETDLQFTSAVETSRDEAALTEANSEVEETKNRMARVGDEDSPYSLLSEETKNLSTSGQSFPWTMLDTENVMCPFSSNEVEMQSQIFSDSSTSTVLNTTELQLTSSVSELPISNVSSSASVSSGAAFSAVPPTLLTFSTVSELPSSLSCVPVVEENSCSATPELFSRESSVTPMSMMPILEPCTVNTTSITTPVNRSVSALELTPSMATATSTLSPLSSILTPPHSAVVPLTPVFTSPGSPLIPPSVITPESPDPGSLVPAQESLTPTSPFSFAGRIADTTCATTILHASSQEAESETSSSGYFGSELNSRSGSIFSSVTPSGESDSREHSGSTGSGSESNSNINSTCSIIHSASEENSHAPCCSFSDRVLRSAVNPYTVAPPQPSYSESNSNSGTPKRRRSRRFKSTPVKSWCDPAATTPPKLTSQSRNSFARAVAATSVSMSKVQSSHKTISMTPGCLPLISGSHDRITRSCDPPPLSPLNEEDLLEPLPDSHQTPGKSNSARLKDFTINMMNSRTLPRPSSILSEKMASCSLSHTRDILLKNFHIPIVDCSSNSPPKLNRRSLRPRRHTLGHATLTSIRQEAERLLSTTENGRHTKMNLRSRHGRSGLASDQTSSNYGSDSSADVPRSSAAVVASTFSHISSVCPSEAAEDLKIALTGISLVSASASNRVAIIPSSAVLSNSDGLTVDIWSSSQVSNSAEQSAKCIDTTSTELLDEKGESGKYVPSTLARLTPVSDLDDTPAAQTSAVSNCSLCVPDILDLLQRDSCSLPLCSKDGSSTMAELQQRDTRENHQNLTSHNNNKGKEEMGDFSSLCINSFMDELCKESLRLKVAESPAPQGLLRSLLVNCASETDRKNVIMDGSAEKMVQAESARESEKDLPGREIEENPTVLPTPTCRNIDDGDLAGCRGIDGGPPASFRAGGSDSGNAAHQVVDKEMEEHDDDADDDADDNKPAVCSKFVEDTFFSCENFNYPCVPITEKCDGRVLSLEQMDLCYSMRDCIHCKMTELSDTRSFDGKDKKVGKKKKAKRPPKLTKKKKKKAKAKASSRTKSECDLMKDSSESSKDECKIVNDPGGTTQASQEQQVSVECEFEKKENESESSQKPDESCNQDNLGDEDGLSSTMVKSQQSSGAKRECELVEDSSESSKDECKIVNDPGGTTQASQKQQVSVECELEKKENESESSQKPDESCNQDNLGDEDGLSSTMVKSQQSSGAKRECELVEDSSESSKDECKIVNDPGGTTQASQKQQVSVECEFEKKENGSESSQKPDESCNQDNLGDKDGLSGKMEKKKKSQQSSGAKTKCELMEDSSESSKDECKIVNEPGGTTQASQEQQVSVECEFEKKENGSESSQKPDESCNQDNLGDEESLSGKMEKKKKSQQSSGAKGDCELMEDSSESSKDECKNVNDPGGTTQASQEQQVRVECEFEKKENGSESSQKPDESCNQDNLGDKEGLSGSQQSSGARTECELGVNTSPSTREECKIGREPGSTSADSEEQQVGMECEMEKKRNGHEKPDGSHNQDELGDGESLSGLLKKKRGKSKSKKSIGSRSVCESRRNALNSNSSDKDDCKIGKRPECTSLESEQERQANMEGKLEKNGDTFQKPDDSHNQDNLGGGDSLSGVTKKGKRKTKSKESSRTKRASQLLGNKSDSFNNDDCKIGKRPDCTSLESEQERQVDMEGKLEKNGDTLETSQKPDDSRNQDNLGDEEGFSGTMEESQQSSGAKRECELGVNTSPSTREECKIGREPGSTSADLEQQQVDMECDMEKKRNGHEKPDGSHNQDELGDGESLSGLLKKKRGKSKSKKSIGSRSVCELRRNTSSSNSSDKDDCKIGKRPECTSLESEQERQADTEGKLEENGETFETSQKPDDSHNQDNLGGEESLSGVTKRGKRKTKSKESSRTKRGSQLRGNKSDSFNNDECKIGKEPHSLESEQEPRLDTECTFEKKGSVSESSEKPDGILNQDKAAELGRGESLSGIKKKKMKRRTKSKKQSSKTKREHKLVEDTPTDNSFSKDEEKVGKTALASEEEPKVDRECQLEEEGTVVSQKTGHIRNQDKLGDGEGLSGMAAIQSKEVLCHHHHQEDLLKEGESVSPVANDCETDQGRHEREKEISSGKGSLDSKHEAVKLEGNGDLSGEGSPHRPDNGSCSSHEGVGQVGKIVREVDGCSSHSELQAGESAASGKGSPHLEMCQNRWQQVATEGSCNKGSSESTGQDLCEEGMDAVESTEPGVVSHKDESVLGTLSEQGPPQATEEKPCNPEEDLVKLCPSGKGSSDPAPECPCGEPGTGEVEGQLSDEQPVKEKEDFVRPGEESAVLVDELHCQEEDHGKEGESGKGSLDKCHSQPKSGEVEALLTEEFPVEPHDQQERLELGTGKGSSNPYDRLRKRRNHKLEKSRPGNESPVYTDEVDGVVAHTPKNLSGKESLVLSDEPPHNNQEAKELSMQPGKGSSVEQGNEVDTLAGSSSSKENCEEKSKEDTSSRPTQENWLTDQVSAVSETPSPPSEENDTVEKFADDVFPDPEDKPHMSKGKKVKRRGPSDKLSLDSVSAPPGKVKSSKSRKRSSATNEEDILSPSVPDSKRMKRDKKVGSQTEEAGDSSPALKSAKRRRESSSTISVTKSYPIRSRASSPQVMASNNAESAGTAREEERTGEKNEEEEDGSSLLQPAKKKRRSGKSDDHHSIPTCKITPPTKDKKGRPPTNTPKSKKRNNLTEEIREAWQRLCEMDEEE